MVESLRQPDLKDVASRKTPTHWFRLANANDSEAYINWAALKTNRDIPLDRFPKPLDEEELLVTIESEAYIPQRLLATAPKIPSNLTTE